MSSTNHGFSPSREIMLNQPAASGIPGRRQRAQKHQRKAARSEVPHSLHYWRQRALPTLRGRGPQRLYKLGTDDKIGPPSLCMVALLKAQLLNQEKKDSGPCDSCLERSERLWYLRGNGFVQPFPQRLELDPLGRNHKKQMAGPNNGELPTGAVQLRVACPGMEACACTSAHVHIRTDTHAAQTTKWWGCSGGILS